jgi:hypothetical protein
MTFADSFLIESFTSAGASSGRVVAQDERKTERTRSGGKNSFMFITEKKFVQCPNGTLVLETLGQNVVAIPIPPWKPEILVPSLMLPNST